MKVVNLAAPEMDKKVFRDIHFYIGWTIRGGLFGVGVLGIFYLILLNNLATAGFDLETMKGEKMGLQKELESLDIALAIPESLYALESVETIQKMPEVQKKIFVNVEATGVAFFENYSF